MHCFNLLLFLMMHVSTSAWMCCTFCWSRNSQSSAILFNPGTLQGSFVAVTGDCASVSAYHPALFLFLRMCVVLMCLEFCALV